MFITGISQTTWYEVSTDVHNKLNTIDFPTTSIGYIGGNDTLLLKTTDGGTNWNAVNFNGVTVYPGGEDILDLNFVDENIGYMSIGPYGGTYKTIDGGLNWSLVNVSLDICYVRANYFFEEDRGVVGGSGCFGGERMDVLSMGTTTPSTLNFSGFSPSDIISQIDFLDENYGLASSLGGRIYRTTDGGATWDTIPSSMGTSIPITSIKIIDESLAYAGYNADGGGFGLLQSTDNGITWSQDGESGTFYYPAFYEIIQSNSEHIYVAAVPSFIPEGVIFEHNGEFWNYWNVDQPVYAMDTYGDSVVWAVGDSGYVVVNTPPSMLSMQENNLANQLHAYPNPFSSTTSFDFSNFYSPKLSIYDAQGRLLDKRTINTPNQDLSYLESGVYVVVLSEGDHERKTKLIKQ